MTEEKKKDLLTKVNPKSEKNKNYFKALEIEKKDIAKLTAEGEKIRRSQQLISCKIKR